MNDSDDIAVLLRQSAVDFLQARVADKPAIGSVSPFNSVGWRELEALGWLGVGLPESLGGQGLGLREAAVLCEEFGRAASPIPYLAASLLPSLLMAKCAPNSGILELAALLTSGERPFAIAWQESAGQVDDAMPLTQIRDGRISGRKRFVVGACPEGILLVTAESKGLPVLAAVDASATGVMLERYAAGLASDATICFEHAPILFGAPLASGPDSELALVSVLQAARVALSAQLTGLAAGVLEKTLAYVGTRVQFGRPISGFQSIRHRCVDLHVDVRLASASWSHALRTVEAAADTRLAAMAVSAAKARCGDVAVQTSVKAIQMHGAMGFTEEGGVGAYLRAALHGRAWLGMPMVQRRRFVALNAESEEVFHA
ncbi:acyl-CoA dehydrogenase family protein [Paraburkholderia phymatum]|uniref:acyl-CoA dehydrogenase family protein n=1 Tax=Paraburkholderia phymatum TaxID=148447 RepID=UPI00317574C5